jgi:hypothetical protein
VLQLRRLESAPDISKLCATACKDFEPHISAGIKFVPIFWRTWPFFVTSILFDCPDTNQFKILKRRLHHSFYRFVHRIRTLPPIQSWLQSPENLNNSMWCFIHRRTPSVLMYVSSRHSVPSVYFALTVRKSQTSGSWVLFENPIIHQVAKTFSVFCGSGKLVSVLCWASGFHLTLFCSDLPLGSPGGSFSSGFPIKPLYAPFCFL